MIHRAVVLGLALCTDWPSDMPVGLSLIPLL